MCLRCWIDFEIMKVFDFSNNKIIYNSVWFGLLQKTRSNTQGGLVCQFSVD
jgi:hypothetical protein